MIISDFSNALLCADLDTTHSGTNCTCRYQSGNMFLDKCAKNNRESVVNSSISSLLKMSKLWKSYENIRFQQCADLDTTHSRTHFACRFYPGNMFLDKCAKNNRESVVNSSISSLLKMSKL